MSDKMAATGMIRTASTPVEMTRNGGNNPARMPVRRLTKRQRVEQERQDRYGRFGRR